MSPQYIPYLLLVVSFAGGVGLSALTFGAYCLRGWGREISAAQRERESARKRGVYRITNTAIGAHYIGSTTRAFAARWGEHVAYLEAGTHTCKNLQRDWKLYGPDAFMFTVVEPSAGDESFIRDREQAWIAALRHELPAHRIYNSEGFRQSRSASDVQATIRALRLLLVSDQRELSADEIQSARAAAMESALATHRQAHPIQGVTK